MVLKVTHMYLQRLTGTKSHCLYPWVDDDHIGKVFDEAMEIYFTPNNMYVLLEKGGDFFL